MVGQQQWRKTTPNLSKAKTSSWCDFFLASDVFVKFSVSASRKKRWLKWNVRERGEWYETKERRKGAKLCLGNGDGKGLELMYRSDRMVRLKVWWREEDDEEKCHRRELRGQ